MARQQNFHYGADANIGAVIGQSLGRALFGDPDARAKLQEAQSERALREAQAAQANAHAGLYRSQTTGQDGRNTAAASLPGMIAGLFAPQAPAAPAPPPTVAPITGDDSANIADIAGMLGAEREPYYAPAEPPAFDAERFQRGMAGVIAALAGMKGDKVDLGETVGSLGAFLGNDEYARRGLIAQGHTPGKDFALTPERADAIAQAGYTADHNKATEVARINHATDIPVEQIRSGDRRYSADRSYEGRTYAADRSLDGTRYKADSSADSKGYDRAGAVSLGSQFGTVTSTVRSEQRNREVGGAANSHHLARRGGRGIDIARKPGVSHAQIEAAYRRAGYTILESLDEGDHSHLALAGGPKAAKPKAPAVKTVDKSKLAMLSEQVEANMKSRGLDEDDAGYSRYRQALLRRATQLYQQTGNPVEAVAQAAREGRAGGKPAAQPAKAAPAKTAAKPAPQGGKPDAGAVRKQALAAIAKGANPAQVRARFKQMTGQSL